MRPGLVPLAVALTANVASLLPVERIAAGPSEPGRQIYDTHCASCHGQKLEGQPNWRIRLPTGRLPAPPHDAGGHTWHHTDDELFRITKFGLGAIVADYESDMPAFRSTLSDDEIAAVLDFIKSTWPERERDYQRKRTLARSR
jgi:mono/diheme cytochrome c family protein